MFQRHVVLRLRKQIRRIRRFVVFGVLHADDPPHRLALGVAIGIFVTFTPTVGIQMVLAVFLSWLLSANKAVGVPIVWLSNPATLAPIFYPCYVIGRSLLGRDPIGSEWWNALASPPAGWFPAVGFYWNRLMEIAAPLWLGCLVVATVTSVPAYYAAYYLIRLYRLKRWGMLTPPVPELRRVPQTAVNAADDGRVS